VDCALRRRRGRDWIPPAGERALAVLQSFGTLFCQFGLGVDLQSTGIAAQDAGRCWPTSSPATSTRDLLNNRWRRWPIQAMRPGRAVQQSRQSLATIPLNPLANRPRADACGLGYGLRLLPALDLPHDPLST